MDHRKSVNRLGRERTMNDRFDQFGNLMLGKHEFTFPDFWEQFVVSFPLSNTRLTIGKGFANFLLDLLAVFETIEIWADGSFTTMEVDPNDIDTVTVVHNDQYGSLTNEERRKLFGMFEGSHTAKKYKVDSYVVTVYDQSHPGYQSYLLDINTRMQFFTNDREGRQKGIVSMQITRQCIPYLKQILAKGGEV